MRIDNPSISGSLSFLQGTNTISGTSVSLTGSLSGTFEGQFSGDSLTNISGAFDSVSASLASDISLNASSINSLNAASSSYALEANISGAFTSVSASIASDLVSNYLRNTTDTLDGDLTVTGKITAQEFHTEFVSASIIYQSGSTQFGNSSDDTHIFSGSISVSNGIAGTLSTATQTNITSVGTLSSLAVSGNLTVDTNTLFVDAANNRVGIGTSSPTYNLVVSNNGAEGFEFIPAFGSNINVIQNYNRATSTWGTLDLRSNDYIFRNQGSEAMRIDSSGNVGIGTASPAVKTHIYGGSLTVNDESTYALRVSNNSNKGVTIGYDDSNNVGHIGSINPATAWTDLVLNVNGGNVGFGTSSPTEKLTVNGNINFPFSTSGVAYFGIQPSPTNPFATNAKELVIRGANAYTAGTPTQAQAGGDVYIKGGYGVANTGLGVYAGDVSIEGGEVNGGGETGAGNVIFKTAGTERMRIDASGNVGIGTTGTDSRLSVSGTNSGSVPLLDLKASGTGTFQRGVRLLNAGMNVGDHIMYSLGQADGSRNMGQTYFYYAGSNSTSNRISMGLHSVDDVFNITGAGNVGIGTTSPSNSLHVYSAGNTRIRIDSGNNNAGIMLSESGSNKWSIASVSGGDLQFFSEAGLGNLMRLSSTGNLGIGTTSPGAKLHVANSGASLARFERIGSAIFDLTVSDLGAGAAQLWLDAQTNDTGFIIRPKDSDGTKRNALFVEPAGHVTLSSNLYLVGSHTRISGDGSGEVGINYSTTNTSTYSLRVYDSTTQVFGVRKDGNIYIKPGATYSQTYSYSDSWASGFVDVVPTGTLSNDRVYLFIIWTNSFGQPPYYAAASAIITTSQGTNSSGAGPEVDLITAHHVNSTSKWQLRMSTAENSDNGVQVKLLNGPTGTTPAVSVRVTEISDF